MKIKIIDIITYIFTILLLFILFPVIFFILIVDPFWGE